MRAPYLAAGRLLLDADRIAEAARGLDDVDAELLAQSPDEHFDRVRVAVEILLVQMFDDLAARDDAPGVVHEIGEQAIFVARELDRHVVHRDAPGAGVEPDRADGQIAGGVAGGAAQQRAQARQHFLHVEGLRDIIVGAGVNALDLVAPSVAGGQDQDRHRASALAPGFEDRDPVAFGQADVEHDRVVRLGVAAKPALLAVERAVDRIARGLERGGHLTVQIPIVLDNQKPHGAPAIPDSRRNQFLAGGSWGSCRFARLVRLVGLVRFTGGARRDFPGSRLHIDMHESPVPMQQSDLVNEILSGAAKSRR